MANALRAPLSWRSALPLLAGLLALLGLTNRWLSWERGIDVAGATDQLSYLEIVHAYPGLPDSPLADQHAQRWTVHWLVAALADLIGAAPETVYRWAAIALAIAFCVVLCAVLMRLGVGTGVAALALAVLVLNPYALRFYGLGPGYLADLLFDLGLAALLLGLVARRLPLVVAGLAAGILARQTMLLIAPVAAAWIALAPAWRARLASQRGRTLAAVLAIATPLAVYLVVKAVAADFSKPGYPLSRLTILDTVMDLPGTAGDLVSHTAHVAIVLLPIAALLAATLWRTGLRGLPFELWGALAIGLVVIAQALALNPDPFAYDYSSSNEPRLTAIALGPLIVALAIARMRVEASSAEARRRSPALAAVGVALLAVGSLHQTYTVVSTGSGGGTLGLQLAVAGALFAAVRLCDSDPERARGEPAQRQKTAT